MDRHAAFARPFLRAACVPVGASVSVFVRATEGGRAGEKVGREGGSVCVCVCSCVSACVRACVRACVLLFGMRARRWRQVCTSAPATQVARHAERLAAWASCCARIPALPRRSVCGVVELPGCRWNAAADGTESRSTTAPAIMRMAPPAEHSPLSAPPTGSFHLRAPSIFARLPMRARSRTGQPATWRSKNARRCKRCTCTTIGHQQYCRQRLVYLSPAQIPLLSFLSLAPSPLQR